MAEKSEKQLVVGILAHVDSGKTTLSEAMLYRAGSIRKLGRVDNKDAFLDTDTLEKARGITIFSKQALLKTGSTNITLLDTPGHVDFSTETERTLQVLDYAVLVISGTDGVQSHTETLWRLLRRYHIPTFVFINKMDLPGPGKEALLSQLSHRLGDGFVDFGAEQAERDEALALCDERLMEKMLDAGSLTAEDIIPAIARRHVFPCWFGVALQRENAGGLQGVDELLAGLDEYTRAAPALEAFGARVFKVSQDERGERLTWLRVTGGELKVKAQLTGEADGEPWAEKANQLRLYSGAKYTPRLSRGPSKWKHRDPALCPRQPVGPIPGRLRRSDHLRSDRAIYSGTDFLGGSPLHRTDQKNCLCAGRHHAGCIIRPLRTHTAHRAWNRQPGRYRNLFPDGQCLSTIPGEYPSLAPTGRQPI